MRDRIEVNPKIMFGKPVIKGTRITVEHVLKLLKQGLTVKDILRDYPHVKKPDIEAAVDYATESVSRERVYPLGKLSS